MTRHLGWMEDLFLLEHGFTIHDPGPGQPRRATRGDTVLDLEPACRCEYCPPHKHPNYIHTSRAA
jgi:hypothetical protein